MLGELSLDGGCVPSPEAQSLRHMAGQSNGHSSSSSSSSEKNKKKNNKNGEDDSKSRELSAALKRIEALEGEVRQQRETLAAWSKATSSLVNAVLMGPRQNGSYAAEVSRLLEGALGSLSFVDKVRYVNCSFPAAPVNAPKVELVRFERVESSEWFMSFSPAWSCEVCVDGRLAFSTLVKVLNCKIEGRLKLELASDLSKVAVGFVEAPETHVDVECAVIIGQLPLPVRETLGSIIRDVAKTWINDNLVHPKKLDLALHDAKKGLTEADIAAAHRAALVAAARARHDTPGWSRSVSR